MKIIRYNNIEYKLKHVDELDDKEKTNLKSFNPDSKHDKYVLSEDGYRVPIIRYNQLNKYQYTIVTPIGTIKYPNGIVHTEKPYNGFGDGTGTKITDKQRKFAEIYAATRDRYKAIVETYGTTDKNNASVMAHKLLSMKKVKNLVDKLTKEAMDDLGIDRLWILQGIKDIAEDTEDKSRLSALKELSEIIGMKKKVTINASTQLPDHILREITGESQGTPTGLLTEYAEVGDDDKSNGSSESETPEEDVQ